MLDDIKKSLIEDIDIEISSIEKAVSEYTVREQQISDSIYTKVGIIDRLFKTKKYKEKMKNDSILRKEESDIYEQKRSKESKLKELNEKKNKVKKIDDVKNLPFKNSEEIQNYCQEKNISITSEDYFKYFREDVSINDELMMSFVKENLSYLKYDKSNNPEIYKYFLNKKINEYEQYKDIIPIDLKKDFETTELETLKELLNALNNHTYNEEFEKHIMEWIKKRSDFFIDFKKVIELKNIDDINDNKYSNYLDAINVRKVINLDYVYKQYQSDFGKELQELYKNDSLLIGVHGTEYGTDDIKDNKIFVEGLKNSSQAGAVRCMDRTVAYDLPFIDLLDYGSLRPNCNYYIVIPKEIYYSGAPIWGSDMDNSDENYLLPEYVYGMVDRREKKDFKFIKNNLPNKKKYSVFYADYSNEPIYYSDENKSVSRK